MKYFIKELKQITITVIIIIVAMKIMIGGGVPIVKAQTKAIFDNKSSISK